MENCTFIKAGLYGSGGVPRHTGSLPCSAKRVRKDILLAGSLVVALNSLAFALSLAFATMGGVSLPSEEANLFKLIVVSIFPRRNFISSLSCFVFGEL